MEIKKSEKVDLESKKPVFVQIGLVLALSIMLFGFEYKSYDEVKKDETVVQVADVIEEVVMQTQRESKPEPPPPAQVQTTLLNIVDNNVQVADVVINTEDDDDKNAEVVQTVDNSGETKDAVEEEVFQVVEENADYPGGTEARMSFLKENLKYPQIARESGIDGVVYVEFIVEKDGSISKPTLKRDIGGGCGEEAIRVVKSMPKWKPGKQRGKPVRSMFVLPIRFVLN